MFVFVSRREICRQPIAYRDYSQNAEKIQFLTCARATPLKKFRGLAKVPYLPNPEHQKGVNAALFAMARRLHRV